MAVVLRSALAAVLVCAAAAKVGRFRPSRDALATFGLSRALRAPAIAIAAGVEAALAVAVAWGVDAAAYAAAGLLVAFALGLGVALAAGRGGAPCPCFGARSRVTPVAVVRNLVLAGAFAAVPSIPSRAPGTTAWLAIGLVAAFACIGVLAVAMLALAREVGTLRLRLAGGSALEIADEGPPLGLRLERLAPTAGARLALAIFSSDGCPLCRELDPVVAAFRRDPLLAVEVFDEARDADVWRELAIPGSPFAVAVDPEGAVRAKGTFNSYDQLESILAAAERRGLEARA